jgi:signal transduction histidine kinase
MDAPQIKHRKRKVLVVDSSSSERTSLWMILKEDYIVLTSRDLEEAVRIAEREGVEIVLVGAVLPLFSYRSFFQALRKARPWLPFLVLLGEKAWGEAVDLPFTDWLNRPFTGQSLLRKVQALLLQSDWVEQRANSFPLPIPLVRTGEKENFFEATISALAHEIKNPLVAVNTFADLLPEKFEDPEFRDQFSRLVGLEVKRINELLENLLEYADLSVPYLNPTYLDSVLLDVLRRDEKDLAQRGVHLVTELREGLPAIPFDEKQLKFVIRKILEHSSSKVGENNSIRFSTESIDEGIGRDRKQFAELMIRYEGYPEIMGGSRNPIGAEQGPDFENWSLALLLAWKVMARNQAMMQISLAEGGGMTIRLRFPVAE